jgi:ATP-dependent DNA helicase RecG
MIFDNLHKQISLGDTTHTEIKSQTFELESVAKTVCAFLNTHGGTIFCLQASIPSNPKSVSDFAKKLNDFVSASISPVPLFTVNVDSIEGENILSIDVPEGKDRPYIFAGAVYLRDGSKTRLADSAELRNMVQTQSAQAERWERRPSTAMIDADLDEKEVKLTAEAFKEPGIFLVPKNSDNISVLRALSVFNSKGFTQAADVLFSKNPALRHPQTRVRVTRFASDKVGDKFLDDRMLQGPMVSVFEQAFEMLSKHVRLESTFSPGDLKRKDKPEYPFHALREGLINAFAHRDYASFSGGVTVGIFNNRIEIWNSGNFPKELKPSDLKKSHPSVPTNPDIAQVFHIRGLMERIGRGGQLILDACKEYSLPAPKWFDKPSGVTLIFYGREEVEREIRSFVMNERQIALLKAMKVGTTIRPGSYRKEFAGGLSERQARRDLVELEEAGLLKRVGKGAASAFERTAQAWEPDTPEHMRT